MPNTATTPHHNCFTALFPGPPGWAGARRKLLLDFMVLGRITRGIHTDNPDGRHSIRTNQQSTSINPPIFTPDVLPAATVQIYPGLGQTQGYTGFHTPVAWFGQIQQTHAKYSISLKVRVSKFCSLCNYCHFNYHHHNHFAALFPGPPGWAGARRELLDFMVQGEINRGRHTDHPAGRHSIRTNQCPPPPSPHYLYRPDVLPAAQPTVSKHWRHFHYWQRKCYVPSLNKHEFKSISYPQI